MRALALLASTLAWAALSLDGQAQQPARPGLPGGDELVKIVQFATSTYLECVKSYSLKFATTAASAADIGAASIAACTQARQFLRQTLTTPNRAGTEFSQTQASEVIVEADRNALTYSAKTILETRYPSVK